MYLGIAVQYRCRQSVVRAQTASWFGNAERFSGGSGSWSVSNEGIVSQLLSMLESLESLNMLRIGSFSIKFSTYRATSCFTSFLVEPTSRASYSPAIQRIVNCLLWASPVVNTTSYLKFKMDGNAWLILKKKKSVRKFQNELHTRVLADFVVDRVLSEHQRHRCSEYLEHSVSVTMTMNSFCP